MKDSVSICRSFLQREEKEAEKQGSSSGRRKSTQEKTGKSQSRLAENWGLVLNGPCIYHSYTVLGSFFNFFRFRHFHFVIIHGSVLFVLSSVIRIDITFLRERIGYYLPVNVISLSRQ